MKEHLRVSNSKVERSVLGGTRRFLLGPGHQRSSRIHPELPQLLSPGDLDSARTGGDGVEGPNRQTSSEFRGAQ